METTTAKTVLITGSTRGIGLAFVELYQKSGWNVIAAARNLATADKLKLLNPYKLVQMDTSDEQSILNAASELQGEAVDLLINNAGIGIKGSLELATKEALMQQFETNAVGPFLVTRAFLPHLRAAVARNGQAIVAQISSVMGSIDDNHSGGLYGYRASKSALNMINASLAIDLKNDKIITVSLHPGWVATDMTDNNGKVTPDESVSGLGDVIASVTEADAGAFIRYDGKRLPW